MQNTVFNTPLGNNPFSFVFNYETGAETDDKSWDMLAMNIKTKQQYRATIDLSLSSIFLKNKFELEFCISHGFITIRFGLNFFFLN